MSEHRKIDAQYLAGIAAFVRRLVDQEFHGNQREAERGLGISQSHLSQLMRGETAERRPGLSVLIRLHEHTGASFDEILGVTKRPELDERLARIERRLAELEAERSSPPDKPTGRR